MFSYTHVVSLAQSSAVESFSASSGEPPGITDQTSTFSYGETLSIETGFIQSSTTDSRSYTGPLESFAFGHSASFKTSYSFGTAPRSVTSRQASSTHQFTNSSTSDFVTGTLSLGVAGSSTGVDSVTYTISPTSNTTITQNYTTVGSGTSSFVLSATASATTTVTGAITQTISNVTTLVPFFAISVPTVQRWYVARQLPPPLRKVALAFAATHTAGVEPVAGLSTGSNSYFSDLGISSTSQSMVFAYDTGPVLYASDSITHLGVSYKYLTSTQSSFASGIFSAARNAFLSSAFLSNGSVSASLIFTPSVAEDWTTGAQVAENLFVPSIFTERKTATGMTATTFYQWKYDSSWKLQTTITNSSTSSSGTIAVSLNGTTSLDTQTALTTVGVTTAVLGPKLPITASSADQVSLTTVHTGGSSAFYSGRNNTQTGSTSSLIGLSSSTVLSFGSGTFENTFLPYAAANGVWDISTSLSNNLTISETGMVFGNENASIPSIYRASKWNEAGRGDPVSVDQ